ncbi:MAG TPA: hypothetical protein VKY19_07060 [Ktedonosporobacter sp.]|nr:hypothetical protein [Ktedonosporobacter sp.]
MPTHTIGQQGNRKGLPLPIRYRRRRTGHNGTGQRGRDRARAMPTRAMGYRAMRGDQGNPPGLGRYWGMAGWMVGAIPCGCPGHPSVHRWGTHVP